MDPNPQLKRDLSMLLGAELAKQLLPGEGVVISLPGSFGEAFVVTDKRAIVVRECNSGTGCETHAYALANILGATAAAAGTGGYIELQLSEPLTEPDYARVYFPTYDLEKFQQAAQFVSACATATAPATVSAPVAVSVAPGGNASAVGPACSKCGAAVEEFSAFCGQCGTQLRTICSQCGASSMPGDRYCRGCGREMLELAAGCQKCGARVLRGMTFCVECGTLQRQSCANCGMNVVDDWKYCPTCGRQLGTGFTNPRTAVARHLQQSLNAAQQPTQSQDQAAAAMGVSTPQIHTEPTSTPSTDGAAEQHNRRGLELFDNDDVEGAIEEFKLAIGLDPGNASYHGNLAVAYDENEQDAMALAEYENTLRLNPNDTATLLCLGYMHNEHEDFDKAREYWTRVVELSPDSADGQEAKTNLESMGQL